MKVNKTISILLVLILCIGLLAGCGGDGDTDVVDVGDEGEITEPNYDDLVATTGGDIDVDSQPDTTSYEDTVAEITAINPNEIEYKIYESKMGKEITDYALVNAEDYEATDKTGTLQYNAETPFYHCSGGNWYKADISTVPVGSLMVIAKVEGTGTLEGVIIFKLAE